MDSKLGVSVDDAQKIHDFLLQLPMGQVEAIVAIIRGWQPVEEAQIDPQEET